MAQVLFLSVLLLLQLQELLLLHKSGCFFAISLSPVPQASQDPESPKDGLKQSVPITVQHPRRPHLGEGDTREMESQLLNLPLGVKIPVVPGSKPVFSRGKLGEKLHRPSPCFTLDDPYCYQLSTAYNCLHDPILRNYHNREDILWLLKKQGFLTSDNKVICTLKEFNEQRQYLTRRKLESEKLLRQQEDGPKLPGTTKTSRRGKRRLQPQKPSDLPPAKKRKPRGCRNWRAALDEGQSYSRTELGQKDANTAGYFQRKPDGTANDLFNAVFEPPTAAEAKKLEELVETVVHRVLERLKIPGNQKVSFLQRAARGIRGRLLGSCLRVELSDASLDHRQKMEVMAKEIVATVLEILGDRMASSTSIAAETGVAARGKELPRIGRATQADKSKDTETATADRALSQIPLDTFTREVVESVHCTLESFVSSQLEPDTSRECTEILELPGGNVSNRQLQPSQTGQGFPRASEQQSLKATLPAPAEGDGCAKTMKPEDCAMVKENLERKMNLESPGSANTMDIRPMANRIADSVLERISQSGSEPAPKENIQGPVTNPGTSQGGEESCAAEDTLPPMNP